MEVCEAIQAFLHEHINFRDLSGASARAYTQRLKSFAQFLEQRGIFDLKTALTGPVVADYFQHLAQTTSKASTIYAKKQALIMFWKWAYEKGLSPAKPFIRLKKPPVLPAAYLTPEEAARMEIAAQYGTTPLSTLHLRDQAAFAVLAELGISIRSLVCLKVQDFAPQENLLSINGLSVKISASLKQILVEYLIARQATNFQSPYLFPSRSGKRWRIADVRRAVSRHRQKSQLEPLRAGQPTHPAKWPSWEREIFLSTSVAPYDLSVEQGQLIISLGLRCGLRRAEMLKLKARDVDLQRCLLNVHGKGSKERKVMLDSFLVRILRPIVQSRTPDQHLLLNHRGMPISSPRRINEIVRRVAERAGIVGKKVTPHTLRHTFATNLSEKIGAGLPMMQRLLGHSRSEETLRYIHPDECLIRKSIEQLGQLYTHAGEQIVNQWANGGLCSR